MMDINRLGEEMECNKYFEESDEHYYTNFDGIRNENKCSLDIFWLLLFLYVRTYVNYRNIIEYRNILLHDNLMYQKLVSPTLICTNSACGVYVLLIVRLHTLMCT